MPVCTRGITMTMPASLRRSASAIAMGLAFTAILPAAAMAQDTDPGTDEVGFRWQFSFSPAF